MVWASASFSSRLAHHVGDGRSLLADRDVDALNAGALLVDDRVDGHRRLAGLAVADDQLALAAADRDHGVDRLVAGLHRLRHRLAPDHARGHLLDRLAELGVERALAVDRLAERIQHATQQLRTNRHFKDAAGGLGDGAFAQVLVVTQHDRTDRVALEVQRQREGVVRQFDHLALHRIGQAVDLHDAVGHRSDGAFVARFGGQLDLFDAAADEFADFGRIERLHGFVPVKSELVGEG